MESGGDWEDSRAEFFQESYPSADRASVSADSVNGGKPYTAPFYFLPCLEVMLDFIFTSLPRENSAISVTFEMDKFLF